MKTSIISLLFISLFGMSGSLIAQNSSTVTALGVFLNTPFFDEFQQSRDRAEETVMQFKAKAELESYEEDSIVMVAELYNASAEMFNRVLYSIKNDMLIKEKRNYLVNYPDSYSKQVEKGLDDARDYYDATFRSKVAQMTEGEITGSAFLTLIPQLIEVCNTAFQMLSTVKAQIRKFNSDLLDVSMIEPYRFRTWDEIQ
jgi:hypothetical protein